jgi:hypothetical protein
MNVIDQQIAVKDNTFNKYGWTKKCRARYYFEILHNVDLVKELILTESDSDVFLYMLKRFIYTGRTNMFKMWFSVEMMKRCSEELIQVLLYYSIKRDKVKIFDYLFDNYDLTYIDFNIMNNAFTDDIKHESYMLNKIYNKVMKHILPNANLSTLGNAYMIAQYTNAKFMKHMIGRIMNDFNLLDSSCNREHISVEQFLKYFGYEKFK